MTQFHVTPGFERGDAAAVTAVAPMGRAGRAWRRVMAACAAVVLPVLAGCGGGADAPGVAPTPQASLSVALTDPAASGARNAVTVGAPIAATATLRSGAGTPISNAIVQFVITNAPGTSGTVAVLSPASGNGVTDAQGRVTVLVYSAGYDVQGAATVAATATTTEGTPRGAADFQVNRTGSPVTTEGAVFTLSLVDPVTGASRATLSQGQPVTARATLRNGAGQAIPNTLVQFSLTATGSPAAPAVLSPDVGSGITDASGTFSVSIVATSADAQGAGTVAVTAPTLTARPTASAAFQVARATTPDPTLAPVVTIALTDPATGAARTSLSVEGALTATATVRTGTGVPIPNTIVQFGLTQPSGATQPIATISPASGNGTTDAQGRFAVSLLAAGIEAQGAGSITARALSLSGTPGATANFQVNRPAVTLANTTWDPPAIDAFQTSTIRVRVNGVSPSLPVRVNFASTCVSAGKAELPASVLTVDGVATATFIDKGCGQRDTITITATNATPVQTTLDVRAAPAVAVQFVSATPQAINISGVGGGSLSQVVFRVVNAANQPVANTSVSLALETAAVGVTIDGQAGPLTKVSDADGTVSVGVAAGSQPGPVRVRATLATGPTALSSQISIQTGLPTQSRFSLSVEAFNIEGWEYDGTRTNLTIRAADRAGNPAPDGTVVNFRSSGAAVSPSCQTVNGVCSVSFVSQANRPASGRVAVLAWAIGEESFTDLNGNNRYDAGEPFGDLGDAFVDANLNALFETGEDFIRFNPNANSACVPSPLAPASRPDSCDAVWGLAHIRQSTQIVLSGSRPAPVFVPGSVSLCPRGFSPIGNGTYVDTASFLIDLRDINGNPLPAGTTITVQPSSAPVTISGSPVPSTIAPTTIRVTVQATCTCTTTGSSPPTVNCTSSATGNFFLSIKTPLGVETLLGPIGY